MSRYYAVIQSVSARNGVHLYDMEEYGMFGHTAVTGTIIMIQMFWILPSVITGARRLDMPWILE